MWEEFEHAGEGRDALAAPGLPLPCPKVETLQFAERGARYGQAAPGGTGEACVVQADDPAVAGEAEVGLDAVGALFEG